MCCPCAIQSRPFGLPYALIFTTKGPESRSVRVQFNITNGRFYEMTDPGSHPHGASFPVDSVLGKFWADVGDFARLRTILGDFGPRLLPSKYPFSAFLLPGIGVLGRAAVRL